MNLSDSMGILTIKIDDELERKLRREIARRSGGYRKGDLKRCVEEAVRLWLGK